MQLECARYVNTRFAPHSPMGPNTALPPVTATVANAASTSSTAGGPLSGSLTNPMDTFSRDDSRFDAEEIWPFLGTEEGDIPGSPSPSGTPTATTHLEAQSPPHAAIVDGVGIVELYTGLRQGTSVKQWYSQNSRALANIDIRRFITFGVIKGFLYRVHKYAVTTGLPAPAPRGSSLAPGALYTSTGPSSRATTGNNTPYGTSSVDEAPIATATREGSRERAGSFHSASRSAGGGASVPSGLEEDGEGEDIDDHVLEKYLDGQHCFDQICTELEVSEREFTARLKQFPREVLIVHR